MAAEDNLHAGQFKAPKRLPFWSHLRNGDTIVGLNGAVAHNVQHHGNYQHEYAPGHFDSRRMTTFDYSHPKGEEGWSGSYTTPSIAPGPHVYRPEGTMTGMKTMQSPSTSRLPRRKS